MSETPRILLHLGEPGDLADRVRATVPGAEVLVCETYAGVPDLIRKHQPQVAYTVRFAGTDGFPADALVGPGGPAWIANGGVGTDHLGVWDPARTLVTNAAGVAATMMSEYILGGFLHFTLDVPGLQRDKAHRVWRDRLVRPLSGETLLIAGLGQTGQALAARAKAFGMRVIGTRARPQPMVDVDEVHGADDLIDLIPRADFIAVATPLIPATRKLVGAREIAAMKPGVILADVSRGGVVDQSALLEALEAGRVAGAILDVFEVEPLPPSSPLWAMENVLISPHCSSVYAGWYDASFEVFLDNLARWVDGQPLVNVVDPARGY